MNVWVRNQAWDYSGFNQNFVFLTFPQDHFSVRFFIYDKGFFLKNMFFLGSMLIRNKESLFAWQNRRVIMCAFVLPVEHMYTFINRNEFVEI